MESPIHLLQRALDTRPDDWGLRRRVIELAKDDLTNRHLAFHLIAATPDLSGNREARLLHARLVGEADASQERAMLEEMLKVWPDSVEVHEQLSLTCRALGDHVAADSHLLVAKTLEPGREFGGWEGVEVEGGEAELVLPVKPAALLPGLAAVGAGAGVGVAEEIGAAGLMEHGGHVGSGRDAAPCSPPPPPVVAPAGAGGGWDDGGVGVTGAGHHELELVPAAKIEPASRGASKDRATAAMVALLVHVGIALALAAVALSLPRPRAPEITAVSSSSQDPSPQVRQQRIAPPAPQVRPSAGAPAPELLTAATSSAVAAPEIKFDAPSEEINLGAGFGAGAGFGNQNMGGGMSFFGMRSEGSTVLVIDISGSMVMQGRDYDYIEREAIRTLQRLPRGAQFNVILFAGKSYPYQERGLLTAEPRLITEVVEWMKDKSPSLNKGVAVPWGQFKGGMHGGTRTDLALEQAFDMKPRTILLLSDGSPTGAKPPDILKKVEEWQKKLGRAATINTVSYRAPASGVEFLIDLAEANGGRFKDL
jgi:hypothetical protein